VIHAGSGNDVIYGGSGTTNGTPNSDIIYGGPGQNTVILGTNNSEVDTGTGAMTLIGNTSGFSVLRLSGSFADYTVTHNADGTTTITDKNPGQNGPVTFKNITDFDFADINQIPVNNIASLPVNDIVHVSGNGPYTISASSLVANDLDLAGSTLYIRELLDNNGNPIARGASGQVNGGTASLSSDGSTIVFTPQTGFTGMMSFRYHIVDSNGNYGEGTTQIGTANQAELSATVSLLTPDDPTNTPFTQQWYLPAINVLPVWTNGYTGAGVSIGVFESDNIDFSNPGLAANEGGEFSAENTPGIEKIGSHATLVGGVIAGALGGTESVGVAYGATLYSEAFPDATNLAVLNDWSKYDIVNNSWGWTTPFTDNFLGLSTYAGYFQNAATNGRNGLGTIIVFSAGNDRATGGNTNYNNNTNSQYEITVGGINAPSDLGSLQIAGKPFSNPGASILVSAPASNITSIGVTMTSEYGQEFGADSETVAGTSLAAPIVSGVIALMLQANPNLGARDVQDILALTAKKVDPTGSNWTFNGATNWNGGGMHTSDDYGFGEVDAAAAVRLAQTWNQIETFTPATNEWSYEGKGGVSVGIDIAQDVPVNQVASTPYIKLPMSQYLTSGNYNITVQHIDIEVALTQVRLSDITIQLVSSTGVVSTLLNRPTGNVADKNGNIASADTLADYNFTFDTVKDWGELGLQDYHLVISYAPGTTPTGQIGNIKTTLYGDPVVPGNTYYPDNYIYTDEFGQLGSDPNNTARSTLSDTNTVVLNAAAVSTGTYLDLHAGSTDTAIAGRSLTIGANTVITAAYGGAGNDTIMGNDAGDLIYGGAGNDVITGGAGNDQICGNGGADKLDGGGGANTVFYIESGAGFAGSITVNLTTGTDSTGSTLRNFQNIQCFDNASDTLIGSSGANFITGGSGNNTIKGMGGADTLNGGGGGINTISYAWSAAGITANLMTGVDSTGSTLTNFQNIVGSDYNDILTGNASDNVISGGLGSDLLSGGAGNDTLVYSNDETWPSGFVALNAGSPGQAGTGEAVIVTPRFRSDDSFDGGDGYDVIKMSDGGSVLALDDSYSANPFGYNTARIRNVEEVDGGNGNDVIDFTSQQFSYGDIVLKGGDGNDVLWGNAGNDTLYGGNGSDNIDGGAGNDKLYGGAGSDTMTGGVGADTFYYTSVTDSGIGAGNRDIITDFNAAEGDRLDLSALGNFIFDGTAALVHNGQSQINYSVSGGNTIVGVDVDGNGIADFQIQLNGLNGGFDKGNFIGLQASADTPTSQINQLVQTMATYGVAPAGFGLETATPIPGDPNLYSALAASWHH